MMVSPQTDSMLICQRILYVQTPANSKQLVGHHRHILLRVVRNIPLLKEPYKTKHGRLDLPARLKHLAENKVGVRHAASRAVFNFLLPCRYSGPQSVC